MRAASRSGTACARRRALPPSLQRRTASPPRPPSGFAAPRGLHGSDRALPPGVSPPSKSRGKRNGARSLRPACSQAPSPRTARRPAPCWACWRWQAGYPSLPYPILPARAQAGRVHDAALRPGRRADGALRRRGRALAGAPGGPRLSSVMGTCASRRSGCCAPWAAGREGMLGSRVVFACSRRGACCPH